MKQINMGGGLKIDPMKLLQSRAVILANSGGGKSHTIRKFSEEANTEVQTIIMDPEGEFSSLREKYDFVLAGKDADVPVETRSAALLATKLLELGKSAVIDMYELHPQERQIYVKLFFEAIVNCPKSLYHPVFIILDEAHEFAPEGKPSAATWAVEALASKGRKRGFCLIPASQRISKLSKNVSAECNNKLIGRASQDIDMKRAGDELGFTKDRLVELRQLKPGEFFAFGPAISDDVIKVKIGDVHTSHAKVGYKGNKKTPPASAVIKKVLGALADLPQEAEKEAKTVAELKAQIVSLKRQKPPVNTKIEYQVDLQAIEKGIRSRDEQWKNLLKLWKEYVMSAAEIFESQRIKVEKLDKMRLPDFPDTWEIIKFSASPVLSKKSVRQAEKTMAEQVPAKEMTFAKNTEYVDTNGVSITQKLPTAQQKIIDTAYWFLAAGFGEVVSKIQVGILAGIKPTTGNYRNHLGALNSASLIRYPVPGSLQLTPAGIDRANKDVGELNTEELHRQLKDKLPAMQWKIIAELLNSYPEAVAKEDLALRIGVEGSSGNYRNHLGALRSLGLIDYPQQGMVKALPVLFLD